MKRRAITAVLVVTGLAAGLLVGCASSGGKNMVGSGDVVADRQRIMKLNGASWTDAQAKIKAGQFEAVAVNAETMALNAEHIPMLFPKGSLTEKSKAKLEVWNKWDEFQAAAKNMQTESEKLRDAARAKNQAQVEAIAKDFGRNACGSCHQTFRVPPPRQG
jgi:cytochrome c556